MLIPNKTTLDQLPVNYLKTVNGLFNLTNKEINVLCELLSEYAILSVGIVDESILSRMLFSIDTRKLIADRLGIKQPVLASVIRQLIKKGALVESDEGSVSINVICIPRPSVTFSFNIIPDGKENNKGPTANSEDLGAGSGTDGSDTGASGSDTRNSNEAGTSVSQEMLDDENPPED